MPEPPFEKFRVHPFRRATGPAGQPDLARAKAGYAELACRSNFTFLTGASHPEELVETAAALGHAAASIADVNTMAGVVRAHVAAKEAGIPLAVGARLRLTGDGATDLIAYPTSRDAYASLCGLLTVGKRRAPKGECHLTLEDLLERSSGLLAIAIPPPEVDASFGRDLGRLRDSFGADQVSLGASFLYRGDDSSRLERLASLAARSGVPLVATGDVLYHAPHRRPLQDVVTCIRRGCTLDEAGLDLEANAERHLKPAAEMARLFARRPEALERSVEIAERASSFSLDELKYEYPSEPIPEGMTHATYLRRLTYEGAAKRYPGGVPQRVGDGIEHELALIAELGYETYFLTCEEIVRFARGRGILCQGRGGAANSAVCFCLGITEVDPAEFSLLFERFVSRERREPPDIDIDFEHERREEVIQHIYERYGRRHAALTAEVITYRGRSAVREVGKALGLSLDAVDTLAKHLDRWHEPPSPERVREAGLNPADPTVERVIELSGQLVGFPRHLSQHVGGFVITDSPLDELVPIENAAMDDRTVIEWDKDDIDAMGMLKVDCLGLGMLTCVRKALELLGCAEPRPGAPPTVYPSYTRVVRRPADAATYEMVSRADTIGVFQIESRAQMSMLPRLRPREFYDLVIEVAIVRPGPIQGGMVHPYLRRRSGEEPVEYPSDAVEGVLGRTLGVPIFQEQAMRLAIVAAGFTADEADGLRKAMGAWKKRGNAMVEYGRRLIAGMQANGYPTEFAERCFEQLKGFSEYGFPESHAASFALIVYVSAWLKRHRPAAFAAALINSQPMGFYAPAQIVRDAEAHGVEVRPIDVNHSAWDCTLEGSPDEADALAPLPEGQPPGRWGKGRPAVRLGMRLVKGLREEEATAIAEAVSHRGPMADVEALWRASGVRVEALRRLARADAFGSMGLDRQRALWQIRPLRDTPMPLFEQAGAIAANGSDHASNGLDALPAVAAGRRVLDDYETTGLSLKAHPISFVRAGLRGRGVIETADLRRERDCPQGRRVQVAGIVLCRQRPSTASGVVFITLEDETGIANLVIWRDTYERYRKAARLSTALLAEGTVERQGEVVHVHARRLESIDALLPSLTSISRDFH